MNFEAEEREIFNYRTVKTTVLTNNSIKIYYSHAGFANPLLLAWSSANLEVFLYCLSHDTIDWLYSLSDSVADL